MFVFIVQGVLVPNKLKGNYNHVYFFCLMCKDPASQRVIHNIEEDKVLVLGGYEYLTDKCPVCGDGNIGISVEMCTETFKWVEVKRP